MSNYFGSWKQHDVAQHNAKTNWGGNIAPKQTSVGDAGLPPAPTAPSSHDGVANPLLGDREADPASAGGVRVENCVAGSQSGNATPLAELKDEAVKHPISFSIPGPPVPAPRMTVRDQWLKPPRPCVERYFKYRDRLRRVVGHVPVPLAITLGFFVPMPESWSQKKRDQMTGQPCRTKPDLDNYIKAVCDGLWENDSAIAAIKACKTWTWESGWTCIDLTP